MKTAIILLSALLLLWIAGSSYVYVCNVRKDCCSESVVKLSAAELNAPVPSSLKTAVEKPEIPLPAMFTLYFDFNKSTCEITNEINSRFIKFKQYLAISPGKKLLVTGHSDNSGTFWSKEYIGAQRAEFVKKKLSETGIVSVVVTTTSSSDRIPIGDNNTAEGRARNRRVEVIIQ